MAGTEAVGNGWVGGRACWGGVMRAREERERALSLCSIITVLLVNVVVGLVAPLKGGDQESPNYLKLNE